MSQDITYTAWSTVKAVGKGVVKNGDWEMLVAKLTEPGERESKLDCPMLKLATFSHGCKAGDMKQVHGLEGDYDGGETTIDEAMMLLSAAGVEAFLYTSASHTTNAPRWRVLAPLSKPHTVAERADLVSLLNGALGGILASESWTPAQRYFFGKVTGVEYETRKVTGACIDTLDLLITPIGKKQAVTNVDSKRVHGSGDDLERLSTLHSVTPETMAALRSAIAGMKPTRAEDRTSWVEVLQALASLKKTPFADEAFVLAQAFSALCPAKYDLDDLRARWDGMSPTKITHKSIFRWAAEDGWKNTLTDVPELAEKREADRIAKGIPFGFSVSKAGVFFTAEGTDDKPGKPTRVCAPLHVTALIRDKSSENWGRVVEFHDADGIRHEWAVPMEMMAGDGSDVRRELSRLGLVIASSLSAKTKLMEYLTASEPKKRARCVQQTGWSDNVFVMPDKTIGDSKDLVMYQSESKTACQYAQAGALEDWRTNVARYCIGNSRLMFAVSAAFAGMILHHAQQESGGFHFVGESGTGKTTAQQVAASVYGGPAFKQSWKATGNALEGACALHNDAALILDEIAEVDAKEIGSIIYMIGNGTGKGRADRTGGARARRTWRLMIISSGEIGLAQHMRDGGKTTRAGQEARMIDVAVDGIYGMFDDLHGFDNGAQLSDAIKEATQAYYGTPAIAFLEEVTRNTKPFTARIKQAMAEFVKANLPADAEGQASRVCNRFALIAVAGEYATDAGITGWQEGEAVKAAATCFKSWLDGRGGGGNQEQTMILATVKAFFESHGESRFSDINDASGRVTINRAGFRKMTGDTLQYLVLTEAYKRDICAGHDMKAVTKVLTDAGWITPDSDGKSSQRMRLPDMGRTRCYVFTPKMWEA